MSLYKLHPSSIGKIMPDPKSIDDELLNEKMFLFIGSMHSVDTIKELIKKKTKTAEDQDILQLYWDHSLSVGAKTYLKQIVKELSYGFKKELDVKAFNKGKACEDEAIELLNSVYFKQYKKHVGRIETDLISGECDIQADDHVRDIKNAWSLDTFPAFKEDAHSSDYEYQLRAYMHLYEKPKAYLDWCLVDTPDDLIKWEQKELHCVSHIDPCLRVTTVEYLRDMEIENRMLRKCKSAQIYIEKMKKQVLDEHGYEYS